MQVMTDRLLRPLCIWQCSTSVGQLGSCTTVSVQLPAVLAVLTQTDMEETYCTKPAANTVSWKFSSKSLQDVYRENRRCLHAHREAKKVHGYLRM